MELVKEHPNQFENESLNQSVHLQQLLGLAVQPPLPPPPPTTSSITPNLNDLTKMLSIINNATSPTSPSLLISPKSSSTPSATRQCTADTQSKNCLNTSNDDSLDSQPTSCNGGGGGGSGGGSDDATSKTRYRRRKPQKTIRMSNELNAIDSVSEEPLENDNRTNAMKHEHTNQHSNGLNFPTFHSNANSILTPSNLAGARPPPQPHQTQTQSMDLSHHCTSNPELFENGLVNYSKTNTSLNLTHTNAINDNGHCNATKDLAATNTGNLMPPDEMNSLNLFGTVNFSQNLRGTHLTNDIATFPNTDDLVKKVEELVKCNEQNGFGNNDFAPMELIKSHANKLVSDAYDSTRLSNGLLDSMKMTSDIEHLNNHHNTGTAKHNGNGLSTEIIQSNPIVTMENKLHENNHDSAGIDNHCSSAKMLSNGSQIETNPNRNGGIKPTMNSDGKRPNTITHGIDNVMSSEFTGIGPVTDMMYEKMTEEIANNQSNLNKNFATNTPQPKNSSSYNNSSNDLMTKEALCASSSLDPTPSNPPQPQPSSSSSSTTSSSSSSSSSSSAPKKKTNNPTNKKNRNKNNHSNASNRSSSKCKANNKSNAGKNSNQKNAKSKDKSDKKSDINEKKKIKSTNDESSTTTETLNKFRGPYVHVSRDGTHEVINAPLNEEISEKQNKFKKSYISQRPADRNRVRGLHVSTLSNKYDAITTDVSWMCVFCKLGPHKYGLGDLFGPFILSTEGEDFHLAQIDPKDDIFGRHQKLQASATKSMPKSASTGNVS